MSPWLVLIVATLMNNSSVANRFEGQRLTLNLRDALDDRRDGVSGDLQKREALEHADVADRLAVQPARGHRGDQVGGLDALVAPGGGDQLRVPAAVGHDLVVRLAVTA